jgi:uncharacterized protein YjbI with pentapeptide repeats
MEKTFLDFCQENHFFITDKKTFQDETIEPEFLDFSYLKNIIFKNMTFVSVSWQESDFQTCIFESCQFSIENDRRDFTSDYDYTLWNCTNFKNCQFKNCNFTALKCRDVCFIDCIFESCSFDNLQLAGATLQRSQLDGTSWNNILVDFAYFIDLKIQETKFSNWHFDPHSIVHLVKNDSDSKVSVSNFEDFQLNIQMFEISKFT